VQKCAVEKFSMSAMDDTTRIGKNFGYMIRGLKRMLEDKFLDAGKAVVEHHFNCHVHCGGWCPRICLTGEQMKESKGSATIEMRTTMQSYTMQVSETLLAGSLLLNVSREVAHSMAGYPSQ
jgi:hypothetical protein